MRYPITPVAKPRMTQRDKRGDKRPVVARYHAFKDECRLRNVVLPVSSARVVFHIPMPKSWSGKKRIEMCGSRHQQKPDIDNLFKALADAVYLDDSNIWDIRITKRWAVIGSIDIDWPRA